MIIDCTACGGAGWLDSLPEGNSKCPYCRDGKIQDRDIQRSVGYGAE